MNPTKNTLNSCNEAIQMRTREDINGDARELTRVLIKAHTAGWIHIDVLKQVLDSARPAAQLELDELYNVPVPCRRMK